MATFQIWLAAGALGAADGDSGSTLQYAPDRKWDFQHVVIDVTPDFQQRTIAGRTKLKARPIAEPLREMKLDAVKLKVSRVEGSETIQGWQNTDQQIIVTFAGDISPSKEVTVDIEYEATPTSGLYFRTPEMGYPDGDTHLWTQGETSDNRHWFPGFDAPNEKFTSELICRVPKGMVALSNGRLVSEETDSKSGLAAFRWLQDKPHANYLIALAAGNLKKVEDRHKDVPLAFYTPASQIKEASNSFEGTKEMMAFFEKEIGISYPWAKYYQVCVQDFVAGGMENTSLTILNDRTLHTADYENLHDSQGLVAHELAHQWFGDLVTCKDWANTWVNEGFATYYEKLYDGYRNGRDELLYSLKESADHIFSQPNQTNGIVRRNFRDEGEQFGYLAYPKGAWVVHMLRSQLGEDLFRKCVKTFLERHQYGLADTEDLNAVFEELSGRSLDQFFDQWVYHAGFPDLSVSYQWDEQAKVARITVEQTQKLSSEVLLFAFDLPVRFHFKKEVVDRKIRIKGKTERFDLPLAEAPARVRIDPDAQVLARVRFSPTHAMLMAQLEDETDVLGRLAAVEQLGERRDVATLSVLKKTLNSDRFYAVRIASSKALRRFGSDVAFEALMASRKQEDARVRRQVLADIGSFYREETCQAMLKAVAEEKNPEIRAAAIGQLSPYPRPEVKAVLLRTLEEKSYRGTTEAAAIRALRAQDHPSAIAPILQFLRSREKELETSTMSTGISALGRLARAEEKKDEVREFLLGYLGNQRRRVQLTAINALADLGDPKAIPALEVIAGGSKSSSERSAAERAVNTLRAEVKPAPEISTLRNDVLNLQTENRNLRKDLEELRNQIKALPKAPATPTTSVPARQTKPTVTRPPKH